MIQPKFDLYTHYRTGRSMFSNANALYQHSPAPDHQHTLMLRSSVVEGHLPNAQHAAGLLRQASYALLNDVVNSKCIKMVAEPLAKMFGIGDLGEMLQHVKHLAETMFYVAEIVETREVSDLDLATYKIFQRGLINESGAISLNALRNGSFESQITRMLENSEIQNINTFLKYLVWGMGPLHALQPSASAGLSENYKQIQDGGFYEQATEAVAGLPAALQAKYKHLPAEQYQQYQLDEAAQRSLHEALCGAFMKTQMEAERTQMEAERRESYTAAVCNLYDHYFQYELALIECHDVSILQGLKEKLDRSLKELRQMYPNEVGDYLHCSANVPQSFVFTDILQVLGERIGVSEANLKEALKARLSETAHAHARFCCCLELDGAESALPDEKIQSAQFYMNIEAMLQHYTPNVQDLIRIRALGPNVIEHLLSSILKSQGIEGNEEKLKTLCATCLEKGVATQENLMNAGYKSFLPSPPVSPVHRGGSSEERDSGDEPLGAEGLQAEAAVAEAARVAAAEAAQERVQTAAALEIQRYYRGHAVRTEADQETERKTSSARLIQAAFRGHTARTKADQETERKTSSATLIQTAFRGHAARAALNDKTAAVVKIQALARGHAARAALNDKTAAVVKIQALARGNAARTALNDKTAAVVKIQALARGNAARTALKDETAARTALKDETAAGVQSAEAVQLIENSASLASRLEEVSAQDAVAELVQAPKEKTQSAPWAKISLCVGVLATTGIGLALAIQTKAIIVPAMITAPSFFAHGLVSTLGAITSPWAAVGIGALGGLAVAGIMLVGWKIYSGIRGRTSKENDASIGPREKNPEPMPSDVVADVVSSTLRGNDARAERSERDNDPSSVVPPRPS